MPINDPDYSSHGPRLAEIKSPGRIRGPLVTRSVMTRVEALVAEWREVRDWPRTHGLIRKRLDNLVWILTGEAPQ